MRVYARAVLSANAVITTRYRGENVNISFGIKLKQYGNVNGIVSHETERRAGRLMEMKE